MSRPWSFEEAVAASQSASDEQVRVEGEIGKAYSAYAKAEETYRVALATEVWKLKSQGIAITACENLAKGEPAIAALKVKRDEAEGFKETAKAAAWRANSDRKDVEGLIDWSKRRELSEGYGQIREPSQMRTFGGRRAA